MKKKSPAAFVNEVRQEMKKVTWSSRREVISSTLMVLVMVAIIAGFFFVVDLVIFNIVQAILGF